MWRNDRMPTEYQSVPAYMKKKRSRLPLTSNPSENEMCLALQNTQMHSFTPYAPSAGSEGYIQPSRNRAPLMPRNEWYQQGQSLQTKAWPANSFGFTGQGCAPVYLPAKPIYMRSQMELQAPPGWQSSFAPTPGFRQDGFPSVSGTSQVQPRAYNGKQPMKQQYLTRQTDPTRVSMPTQQPLSAPASSQGAAAQNEWNFRSVGHASGRMWVEDTFDTSRSGSKLQQQQKSAVLEAEPATRKSLRIITAVIEGMKYWSQFKDKEPMLFKIFGTLNSAVKTSKFGAKNFIIKDGNGSDVVPCVYYENDQVLPKLIRGQVYRCVGNYDRHYNILTCFSVHPASSYEQRTAQLAIMASDAEMRKVVQGLN